jgi:hypothetical protein
MSGSGLTLPNSRAPTPDELPLYVPPRQPPTRVPTNSTMDRSTHYWHIVSSQEVPWATLSLKSRAHAPTHIPYFFQGDALVGAIELTLRNPDSIQAVDIEVSFCSSRNYSV